jgi:hypothetical protein
LQIGEIMIRPLLRVKFILLISLFLGGLTATVQGTQNPVQAGPKSIQLVRTGSAEAAIVVGKESSESASFSAAELQRYLAALSGVQISIIPETDVSSLSAQTTLILLGNPDSNRLIRDASLTKLVNFTGLKPEGYIVKTGHLKKRPMVVVGGNDDAGTLYAVYEFIEQLGVAFLLTGDVIPARQETLALGALDLRREPAFPRRGFLLQVAGFDNLTLFSTADYEKFVDQMAKMRCNYLQVWWFAFAPWLKHSYRGETMWMGDVSTKESGYLAWAHSSMGSRTTDEVTIGKEHFQGRRIAPPEFQNVETPAQAFDVAQTMLGKVIHHAKQRHVKVWLAIEMAALPPNLAQFAEKVGTLPFHPIFGTFVHPLDPVNREIQVERIKALINTYPEAEGYFLSWQNCIQRSIPKSIALSLLKNARSIMRCANCDIPGSNGGQAIAATGSSTTILATRISSSSCSAKVKSSLPRQNWVCWALVVAMFSPFWTRCYPRIFLLAIWNPVESGPRPESPCSILGGWGNARGLSNSA